MNCTTTIIRIPFPRQSSVLGKKTGGVANYVIDGKNGYALSITSTEKEFYEKIKVCIETKTLEKLSYKSALLYKNKLNWNRWGNEVRSLFNSILNKS